MATILYGDIDVTNGLKIIQIPGRYYRATFIAWVKRIAGDEYAMLPGACPIGRLSGERMLGELAANGPKRDHKVFPPSETIEEVHRLVITRCIAADEKAWHEWCPRPKGWEA